MRSHGHASLLLDPQPEESTSHSNRPDLVRPTRSRHSERFAPPPPQSVADLGLSSSILEQLIFKLLYFRGDMLGGDLSKAMGLKFSLIQTDAGNVPHAAAHPCKEFTRLGFDLLLCSLLPTRDAKRRVSTLKTINIPGLRRSRSINTIVAVKAQRMPQLA